MKQLAAVFCALALMACAPFAAAQLDAAQAQSWLEQFATEIAAMQPVNDVLATADPARAGEYLLEYSFGTVAAKTPSAPGAGEILRIELTGEGVRDCRSLSVGQTLEAVLAGREIPDSEMPLYVLSTQESGYGWSWVYVRDGGIYGVEYITYGEEAAGMKEYTLTYVIGDGVITAIRMQVAETTQAIALEGQNTAEEIVGRQRGELLAMENEKAAFEQADMTVSYRQVIGAPVEELVALIGEPQEIQVLPDGNGRMLVYAFCAAELLFDEMTGVETVRSISCVVPGIAGPRGVAVGMEMREAAALFRCDGSVHSTGGVLYLAGEAQGIAPYGEIIRGGEAQYTLRYVCLMQDGKTGVLEIGAADGAVTHWRLAIEETEAAYGG